MVQQQAQEEQLSFLLYHGICETKHRKFCIIFNMFRNASRKFFFFFWAKVISSLAEDILLWPFIVSAKIQGWNLIWSYRKVCTRAESASVSEDPSNHPWLHICRFFVLFMYFWISYTIMVLMSQAAACRQPLTPETAAAGARRAACRWKGQAAQNSLQVQRPGCRHSYLRTNCPVSARGIQNETQQKLVKILYGAVEH